MKRRQHCDYTPNICLYIRGIVLKSYDGTIPKGIVGLSSDPRDRMATLAPNPQFANLRYEKILLDCGLPKQDY